MKVLITTALLLTTAPAFAEFSYDYISGGYTEIDVDSDVIDFEWDGFSVGFSKNIGDNIFVAAGYRDLDAEINGIDAGGAEDYFIEIGGHSSIRDDLDIVLGVIAGREEVDTGQASDFYGADVGLRYWLISELVEIAASFGYQDVYHSDFSGLEDGSVIFEAGVRIQPVPLISIGASYAEVPEFDQEILNVDLRFQF